MDHMATFGYIQRKFLALGRRFGLLLLPQGRLLRLPGAAIYAIIEFLGGLVIYSSRHVRATTKIFSYHYLWVWAKKGTWPSWVSIVALGGRDLDDF